MKNIKTILALVIFAIGITSCSKDDEPAPRTITKEYPENMMQYPWIGEVTAFDIGGQTTGLEWNLKPNGRLEVRNGNQPPIIGEWYMIGNIFTCKYTSATGEQWTYQLIKNSALVMVGFRGLSGETSGSGRVYMYVV